MGVLNVAGQRVAMRAAGTGLRLGLALLGWAGALAEGRAADELPLPGWQHLVSVKPLGGYKNNVTLSAVRPEASGFVGIGIEALGWRTVGDRGEFQAFVVGEERHYLSGEQVHNEQTLVAQMQYEQGVGRDWSLVMPVEYLFVNQVLDVSATQDVPLPTQVLGNGVTVRPAVRRQWEAETVELELAGSRQWYAAPLDDTWEAGMRLNWEHRFGRQTRVDMFARYGRQWYDTDLERTSEGLPIPGETRRVNLWEGGARFRYDWGPKDCWRVTARFAGLYSEDAGSGYYDYWRPAGDVRLRYRRGPWAAETGLRGRHYRYLEQTVYPWDSEPRRRSELMWDLRGERELVSWLRLVVEYALEESFANRVLEEYSVQTISAGVEMSF